MVMKNAFFIAKRRKKSVGRREREGYHNIKIRYSHHQKEMTGCLLEAQSRYIL